MDSEVLKEMEKELGENKTLETLTLKASVKNNMTLPKEFYLHVLFGIRCNTSLSEVHLRFNTITWACPIDGRLVYVSHMLCDSVRCSV